jgi:aerobic carbon-monoxide dehydrogenase large subunit
MRLFIKIKTSSPPHERSSVVVDRTQAAPEPPIGSARLRVEDPDLLHGRARFTGDVMLPGALHMSVVRSPMAHALLRSVDVGEALAIPGVVAVFTAADLVESVGTMPRIGQRVSFNEAVVPYRQPILAEDRVRYVGEPMAIVLAEDRYLAEDASERVFANLDPLPVVLDAPSAGDAPGLFPEGNLVTTLEAGFGDIAGAFSTADAVVEVELAVGRHTGVPMETRGIVVEPDPSSGRMRIHGATKVPHWNLRETAALLGIGVDRLLGVENSVGGGFGVRGELYPEDVLAVWAADALGRPVVWLEDRREHLIATNHSRQQLHRAAIAGSADGRILGLRSEFWVDLGGYVRTHGIRVPDLTLSMLPGPYDIGAYDGRAHCVMTNKTPCGTYRSPGRFESSFVRERLVDLLADRLGIAPVELRRRNLIRPDQLPYRRPLQSTGEPMTFGEGDYPSILDTVLSAAPTAEMERRRAAGETVGWGLAMFLEKSGVGPWESGEVEVDHDGRVHVRSGATSVGQGLRTVLAQIVADRLAIDPEGVVVDLLDTDSVPESIGTYASRSTVTAGSAVVQASDLVVALARRVISDAVEVSADDIRYGAGVFDVVGSPTHTWSWQEVAGMLDGDRAERLGLSEARLAVRTRFDVDRVVYPYGAVWAGARVDVETGEVAVEHLVVAYDIGRAVNPMLVEGQMHGGAIQAVGGALYEQFVFDGDGNPLATSFADYLLPTVSESPAITTIILEDHPTSTNPLGVKGAGEAGLPGVAAAIATAVEHAVRRSGWATRLPIRPGDVRAAIRGREASSQ